MDTAGTLAPLTRWVKQPLRPSKSGSGSGSDREQGARSYRVRLGHVRESQAVYEGGREGFDPDPDPDFDLEQEPPP